MTLSVTWRAARRLGRPLPRAFYDRHCVAVARAVLGRVLVCDLADGRVAGRIIEVEAYRASGDPASHAYRGCTARNAVMFGRPGHAYVYFTYGMHFCVNLVTESAGHAAAVLVRALEPVHGEERMRRRRGLPAGVAPARGPGNVARALGLTRSHNGADLTRGPLWLSDLPAEREGRSIQSGPRVGIASARERPWRFHLEGHPGVSGPRRGARAVHPSRRSRAPRADRR